ncbi:hypothetical protein ACRCUN_06630 [Mycobacterium sp. LTG2003]
MSIQPVLAAGIALASVGAIAAATPPVLPAEQITVNASAPAPKTVTVDQLKLLALSDVTLANLIDVFNNGYGGGVLVDNPYYNLTDEDYPLEARGLPAVAYYVADQTLLSLIDTGLPIVEPVAQFTYDYVTSYFFELGAKAALHVSLAEATGGRYTPLGTLLQLIFNPLYLDGPQNLQAMAATLATPAPDPLSYIPQGIVDAFVDGWGGGIQPDDPYYPSPEEVFVTGFTGVGYYLSDQVLLAAAATGLPIVAPLAEFAYYNVTTYLFEVGAAAALHVSLAEATGGPDTPFAQILQRIFNPSAIESSASDSGPRVEQLSVPADDNLDTTVAAGVQTGNGPEVLPKKAAAVVEVPVPDLASEEESDETGSTDGEVVEEPEGTEELEAEPVKKGPKLNVTKQNPLSDLADKVDDFKKDVDGAAKKITDGLKKLGGGAQKKDTTEQPDAEPSAGDPSDDA